jgi:hypothetical protein
MLGRVAGVLLGGMLFAAGAYMLLLQLTSSEPLRGFIVGMGSALLLAAAYAFWNGLRPRR